MGLSPSLGSYFAFPHLSVDTDHFHLNLVAHPLIISRKDVVLGYPFLRRAFLGLLMKQNPYS